MGKKLYVGDLGKKLYIGNLGDGVTESDLVKMFQAHGAVKSAQVILDEDTGRSKGFGFVEMKTDKGTQAAIAALHGQDSAALDRQLGRVQQRRRRG
jgi:RNA recognition motif-containing protein